MLTAQAQQHGCMRRTGYSIGGGTLFIPMKVAQWCIEAKWLNFPGLKISGSEAVLSHHWAHKASSLETLLLRLCVIRVEPATSGWCSTNGAFNRAALLHFPKVIRPDESNSDGETVLSQGL